MPCEAWQYNTTLAPARVYYMRIDFAGVLPMFGVDVYQTGHGRMVGKLLGLITVADGSGPEFDVSELATYVNDALMLAPSMLLTPAVDWAAVDDHSFDLSMSDGRIGVSSRVSSTSRVAWSTSAPRIAGQLSQAGRPVLAGLRRSTAGLTTRAGGFQPPGMPSGTSIPVSSSTCTARLSRKASNSTSRHRRFSLDTDESSRTGRPTQQRPSARVFV